MSYWQFKKRSCFPAFVVKDAVLDGVPFSDIPKKLLSVEFSQTTQHIDKKIHRFRKIWAFLTSKLDKKWRVHNPLENAFVSRVRFL